MHAQLAEKYIRSDTRDVLIRFTDLKKDCVLFGKTSGCNIIYRLSRVRLYR